MAKCKSNLLASFFLVFVKVLPRLSKFYQDHTTGFFDIIYRNSPKAGLFFTNLSSIELWRTLIFSLTIQILKILNIFQINDILSIDLAKAVRQQFNNPHRKQMIIELLGEQFKRSYLAEEVDNPHILVSNLCIYKRRNCLLIKLFVFSIHQVWQKTKGKNLRMRPNHGCRFK